MFHTLHIDSSIKTPISIVECLPSVKNSAYWSGERVVYYSSPSLIVMWGTIVRFLSFVHGSSLTVLSLGHLGAWSPGVPKLWVVSSLSPHSHHQKLPSPCSISLVCTQVFLCFPNIIYIYRRALGSKTNLEIDGNMRISGVVGGNCVRLVIPCGFPDIRKTCPHFHRVPSIHDKWTPPH